MRVRAKANGNVIDVDDEQGRGLIERGIYETVDALPERTAELVPSTEEKPVPKPPKKRRYKRRDMKAEE